MWKCCVLKNLAKHRVDKTDLNYVMFCGWRTKKEKLACVGRLLVTKFLFY